MTHRSTSLAPRTPVRTCVGCRERATKRELLRVTAGADEHGQQAVLPDPTGTAPGRGAHLHPTTACLDLAVRRRAFARALRVPASAAGLSTARLAQHVAEHLARHTSTTGSARGEPTDP